MGKALYRRYRSKSFDEVVGQDHITKTLKNALEQQTFGHAYLLTGPRGTGKTSVARILAYAVNGLDYIGEETHLDIIEIDAASNRRIDEIRELREKVHIAPTSSKYKIYIIDEVHMLTKEAFNALLKTLEEPPEHVIFILATTDVHKLPDTIVSRCIRFTFKPIREEQIVSHLKTIAKAEKLDITDDALAVLAKHAGGSFRDSISLLEQIKNLGGTINDTAVEHMLGIASEEIVTNIITAVQTGDTRGLNEALLLAYEQGTDDLKLAAQIGESLRKQLIEQSSSLPNEVIVELLRNLLDVAGSPHPKTELELNLMDTALKQIKPSAHKPVATPVQTDEVVIQAPKPSNKKPKNDPKPPEDIIRPEADPAPKPEPCTVSGPVQDDELWQLMLDNLKTRANTLYGIGRMASVTQYDGILELAFKFPFHYKQMNEPRNKAILGEILVNLGRKDLELIIKQGDPSSSFEAPKQPQKKEEVPLNAISNIFGSHEVLES